MGNYRINLNLDKIEWLWILGPPGSVNLLSFALDGIELPKKELICNRGVLLELQLLLKEQVAFMARRVQLPVVHQLFQFLDHRFYAESFIPCVD